MNGAFGTGRAAAVGRFGTGGGLSGGTAGGILPVLRTGRGIGAVGFAFPGILRSGIFPRGILTGGISLRGIPAGSRFSLMRPGILAGGFFSAGIVSGPVGTCRGIALPAYGVTVR